MKFAVLDLGSNTFILSIAQIKEKNLKIEYEEIFYTRLSELDENKKMKDETVLRVENCFKKCASLVKKYDVTKTLGLATSAARDMKDQEKLLQIGEKYNFPISIISGEKEAYYSFKGALFNLEKKPHSTVIDIGGYSTEFSNDQNQFKSLNIGSVRFYQKYIKNDPITEDELKKLEEVCLSHFSQLGDFMKTQRLIANSGTAQSIACLKKNISFPSIEVHGQILSLNDISEIRKKLSSMNLNERVKLIKEEKRADVIVTGLVILEQSMRFLKLEKLEVSHYGLRQGALLSQFK